MNTVRALELIRILVLSQFDWSQMIAHIVLRSISPCLRSFVPHHFRFRVVVRDANVPDAAWISWLHYKLRAVEHLFKGTQIANRAITKCISHCHPSNMEYSGFERRAVYTEDRTVTSVRWLYRLRMGVSKICKSGIEGSNICCDEHYNQPWQRTHIDGPTLKIKTPNIGVSQLSAKSSVKLASELHIRGCGYHFCGPSTRLTKR